MKLLGRSCTGKDFGTVNNILSGCGALMNAGSMMLLTLLFSSQWSWRSIWYLFAGFALLGTTLFSFVTDVPSNNLANERHEDRHAPSLADYKALAKNGNYYLLLAMSALVSVVRINTSFGTW